LAVAQAKWDTINQLLVKAVAEWRSAADAAEASVAKGKGRSSGPGESGRPPSDRKRARDAPASDSLKLSPSAPKPKRSREMRESEEAPVSRAASKSPVKKGKGKAKEDYSLLPGAKPVRVPCETCTLAGLECFTTAAIDAVAPVVCIHCKRSRRGCSKVLRKWTIEWSETAAEISR
jgi:hypothetical protein